MFWVSKSNNYRFLTEDPVENSIHGCTSETANLQTSFINKSDSMTFSMWVTLELVVRIVKEFNPNVRTGHHFVLSFITCTNERFVLEAYHMACDTKCREMMKSEKREIPIWKRQMVEIQMKISVGAWVEGHLTPFGTPTTDSSNIAYHCISFQVNAHNSLEGPLAM